MEVYPAAKYARAFDPDLRGRSSGPARRLLGLTPEVYPEFRVRGPTFGVGPAGPGLAGFPGPSADPWVRPQKFRGPTANPWGRPGRSWGPGILGISGLAHGAGFKFWAGAGPGPKSVRFPHRATPCRAAFFVKLKAGPYSERGRTGGSGGRATPCRAAIGTRPAVGFYAKGGAVGGRRYVGTWGSGTSRF